MTALRRVLPNRRSSETITVEVNGLGYTVTCSRFSDGRLGEVFIGNHKVNSGADTAARDAGILLSLALQHGVDPDVIRHAVSRGGLVEAVLAAIQDNGR
jgi:hypothetical protein